MTSDLLSKLFISNFNNLIELIASYRKVLLIALQSYFVQVIIKRDDFGYLKFSSAISQNK